MLRLGGAQRPAGGDLAMGPPGDEAAHETTSPALRSSYPPPGEHRRAATSTRPRRLHDDSARIDSTGPGTGATGRPLFGDGAAGRGRLAESGGRAEAPNDYTGTYHHLTERDYQQNRSVHGKDSGKRCSTRSRTTTSTGSLRRRGAGEDHAAQRRAASGKQQLEQ